MGRIGDFNIPSNTNAVFSGPLSSGLHFHPKGTPWRYRCVVQTDVPSNRPYESSYTRRHTVRYSERARNAPRNASFYPLVDQRSQAQMSPSKCANVGWTCDLCSEETENADCNGEYFLLVHLKPATELSFEGSTIVFYVTIPRIRAIHTMTDVRNSYE